jgi:hypothetical protein
MPPVLQLQIVSTDLVLLPHHALPATCHHALPGCMPQPFDVACVLRCLQWWHGVDLLQGSRPVLLLDCMP